MRVNVERDVHIWAVRQPGGRNVGDLRHEERCGVPLMVPGFSRTIRPVAELRACTNGTQHGLPVPRYIPGWIVGRLVAAHHSPATEAAGSATMGRNNKARPARDQRHRAKAPPRSRTTRNAGYFQSDPDSGGRYLKQPGIKYAREPDMDVRCPACRRVSPVPVSAMIVPPEMTFSEEDGAHLSCPQCGHQFPIQLRMEKCDDGSTLLWTDRSAVSEYLHGDMEATVPKEQPRGLSGRDLEKPEPGSENWILCLACNDPYIALGTTEVPSEPGTRDQATPSGYCPKCGRADPVVLAPERLEDQPYSDAPLTGLAAAADRLSAGESTISATAQELRKMATRVSRQLANWFESRDPERQVGARLVYAAASLAELEANSARADAAHAGYSPELSVSVIDSMLDYYDSCRLGHTPRPPASRRRDPSA